MRIRSSAAIGLMLSAALLWPTVQGSEQDRLDAVIAAPSSHTIIFENDRVRVLRVTIAPGATEPMHTHAWPSVMRVEAPQPLTYISYLLKDGRWAEAKRTLLPMRTPPEAEWMEPEGPHAVQNRGSSEYRALRIELKPPGTSSRP